MRFGYAMSVKAPYISSTATGSGLRNSPISSNVNLSLHTWVAELADEFNLIAETQGFQLSWDVVLLKDLTCYMLLKISRIALFLL